MPSLQRMRAEIMAARDYDESAANRVVGVETASSVAAADDDDDAANAEEEAATFGSFFRPRLALLKQNDGAAAITKQTGSTLPRPHHSS
jgi:hypothetical protein